MPNQIQDADVKTAAAIQFLKMEPLTAGSVPFVLSTTFLGQDNANHFWDNTNKVLLIGTNTQAGAATLVVKGKNSTTGGLGIYPSSGSEYWTLSANGNNLYLIDPNSNRTIFNFLNTGQVAWGLANPNGAANLDNFLIKNANGVGNTSTTFSVGKSTSQTGDLTDWYDTDGTTKLARIDVTGKLFAANIRDTAFAAIGVVLNNASGDFSTLAPGSNGNILTSDGTNWTSAAPGAAAALDVSTKTANFTVTNSNDVILCNPAAGTTITMTFQTSASATKKTYVIKNISANGNVQIVPNAADTIEGDSVVFLPPGGSPMPGNTFIPDGVNTWYISA